jgi:hypothetical protein
MAGKKQAKEPKRIGRPPVKIDADNLRKLSALRCSVEEAATFFRTVKRTLLRRLKEDPELKEAWENGKNEGRIALRRLQWRHAQTPGSAGVQMTIHLSKHELGETEKSLVEMTGKDGSDLTVTHKIEITMTLPAPKTDDEDRSYRNVPVLTFQPKLVSGKD